MATIRKRNGKYYAEVCVNNNRKGKTFKSKLAAKEWANRIELDLMSSAGGLIPDLLTIDLFIRYAENVSPEKRGAKWEIVRIGTFKRDNIAKIKLQDLSFVHLSDWRDRRLKVVSPGSVNREWNLLSSIFNTAINEWGWLKTNPLKTIKRPKQPNSRDRLPTQAEIELLIHCSGYGSLFKNEDWTLTTRVCAAFLFAMETGMRAGEIASLRAHHINGRVAHLEMTKNGTSRDVPISKKALDILEGLPKSSKVFDLTSMQISSLFAKLRKKSGIEGLTFHDSRHWACSTLSDKLDVLELARMLGIRDLKILMVYYNKKAQDIAKKLD